MTNVSVNRPNSDQYRPGMPLFASDTDPPLPSLAINAPPGESNSATSEWGACPAHLAPVEYCVNQRVDKRDREKSPFLRKVLTKRHCTTDRLGVEYLNRKDAEHYKRSHDHELGNHKWRLRLCRSHCLQGRHLLEGLCYKDKEIQIQPKNDVYCVDPTPGARLRRSLVVQTKGGAQLFTRSLLRS
jgi:hypothetical protein